MKPRFFTVIFACLALASSAPAVATERYGPGTRFEKLTVGAITYRDVRVKTANARTVLFVHRGGMA